MAEIWQEHDFLTWGIPTFVRKVKQFYFVITSYFLISHLLICNWPLLKDISFQSKVFVGLVWLTSNHMFGSRNFWDKSHAWFLKILKLHLGNLSQIALLNMWLIALIDLANKLYHIKKILDFILCHLLLKIALFC